MMLSSSSELVVSVTDLVLAVESAYFALRLAQVAQSREGKISSLVFCLLAAASLLGSIFHAFFPLKEQTPLGWDLWILTASVTGLIAIALWALSASVVAGKRTVYVAVALAGVGFYGFFYWLTRIDFHFKTVVFFYAPALLVFFCIAIARSAQRRAGWRYISFGLLLTVIAAGVQVSSISVGIIDHNAFYHLFQAAGLFYLYFGFRIAFA